MKAFLPALLLVLMAATASGGGFVLTTEASDVPDDDGGRIGLVWTVSPDLMVPDSIVVERMAPGGEWEFVGSVAPIDGRYTDSELENGTVYSYRLVPWLLGAPGEPGPVASATPAVKWLHSGRIGMLVITVVLCAIILLYIEAGKRGKDLFVRRIAGLNAVEDAVGRATEMGRPVMYIPGIMDMDDIQTIASMVILGRVARKAAEYGSSLLVPTCRSVVMSVSQEVVKEAYLQTGRPDAFRREDITYLTDDQFGYAAGVDGMMVRQRPAAIFLLGTFYAESLILAETGKSVGAIQIAGTAMVSQIPFFIAACDYTLIGEELYAASAYLSREPKLLGSLKGQDAAKLVIMILIIVGVLGATAGHWWEPAGRVAEFLRFLTHVE
jgi:hypothetical protein